MRLDDLALSDEQLLLKRSAREFLRDNCPYTTVAQLEQSEEGFSPMLWRQIADLGWTGLVFPETYGGQGGSILDLMVLAEEMGRALLPSPYFASVVLSGLVVLEAGNEEQKRLLIPGIAGGDSLYSLALLEPSSSYEADGVEMRAEARGGSHVLNGTKLLVPYAGGAQAFVCPARTSVASEPEAGVSLFVVPANAAGVSIVGLPNIAGAKLAAVQFRDVRIPRSALLGEVDGGWAPLARALLRATVFQCAEITGACESVAEFSIEYAKQRVQYEQPIGVHQSIQWKCVDMTKAVYQTRVLTHTAAAALNDGEDGRLEVAMAKARASETAHFCAFEGHQIFSGAGQLVDHHLQLYSRRLKAMELSLGDADYHLEKVAEAIGA